MTGIPQLDDATRDSWQVVGCVQELPVGTARQSKLFGQPISIMRQDQASVQASLNGRALPVLLRYGYIWTSFGSPPPDLFAIPEYDETDRRNINAATFRVHVSAPRAVENFLDMAHFPYVHTGYLGEEPYTEVKDYNVEVSQERDEVLATQCVFYQPKPMPTATEGFEVEYTYRVPHPYCAILYKSSPADPTRRDVIALFLQPVDEEHVHASTLLCVLDDQNTDSEMRRFQQTIFGQDKPILENQYPKRLPLDPRAETPIRADKSAIAYRRWLLAKGVTYGTITPRAAR